MSNLHYKFNKLGRGLAYVSVMLFSSLPLLLKRILRVVAVLLFIIPPFIITSNGNNAIRFSFQTLEIYFFNNVFHFDQFFTISIFMLMCVFLFILFTQVFGRLWCGWLCPQSVLIRLTGWIKKIIEKIVNLIRYPKKYKIENYSVISIILSFIAALFLTLVLLFYFVSPYNFLNEFFGEYSYVLMPAFLIIFLFLLSDFVFFRYKWCKLICPYARLQSIMSDSDTLFIGMNKDALPNCIKCKACVRSCPVDIDPRNTPNGECIYCELCITACDKALSKRGGSILGYNWGTSFKFSPFRPNVLITFIISTALLIYFIYLAFFNAPINIAYDKIQFKNDNNYSLNIDYKNRTDGSVMISITSPDKTVTVTPSTTILRARQQLEDIYNIEIANKSAIENIDINIETDNGYVKILTLPVPK